LTLFLVIAAGYALGAISVRGFAPGVGAVLFTAGITAQPAILAYAFRSVPSERVEICDAMIHPTTTVLKIVIAQLLIAAGRSA
jgi:putative transport protein